MELDVGHETLRDAWARCRAGSLVEHWRAGRGGPSRRPEAKPGLDASALTDAVRTARTAGLCPQTPQRNSGDGVETRGRTGTVGAREPRCKHLEGR